MESQKLVEDTNRSIRTKRTSIIFRQGYVKTNIKLRGKKLLVTSDRHNDFTMLSFLQVLGFSKFTVFPPRLLPEGCASVAIWLEVSYSNLGGTTKQEPATTFCYALAYRMTRDLQKKRSFLRLDASHTVSDDVDGSGRG